MPSPARLASRCLPHLVVALLASSCTKEHAEVGPTGGPSAQPTSIPAPSAKPSASASAAAAAPPPVEMPLDERKQIAGQISFVSERDGNREVYLIAPDGTGEKRLTTNTEADYNGPASPDGASLLLIRVQDHEGPQQLFLQPIDGGAPKPLGPSGGRVRYPSFSPDGKWVVYESDGGKTSAEHFSDIYRVGPDGKGLSRLTKNPEGNFEPAISPKGDAVVLVSSRDRVAELYRIKPDGSQPVRLTETTRDEWGARFSPDGEQLVFVSDREGADRLYLMPAAGGEAKRVTRRNFGQRIVEDRPTWAPTGKRIAYVLSAPSTPTRVVIADLESEREVEVNGPDGGQVGEPIWSPDGKYLAVTITRGKDPQIYVVRADGTGLTRLTGSAGGNWNPHWVPARKKSGG